jgi:hypothetical protein
MVPLLVAVVERIGPVVPAPKTADVLVHTKQVVDQRLVEIAQLELLKRRPRLDKPPRRRSLADHLPQIQPFDGEVHKRVDLVS